MRRAASPGVELLKPRKIFGHVRLFTKLPLLLIRKADMKIGGPSASSTLRVSVGSASSRR